MLRSAWILPFVFGVLAFALACERAPCCDSDEQCGEGLGCFDGRCTYTCSSDADCAPSEICARPEDGRAAGVCHAPGEDDDECRERTAPPRADGGQGHDGGPVFDAGPTDAGRPDAGPTDAGRPDAGPTDAGRPDAGPTDAGRPDAGPADAGFDAGPIDDAGEPDAGFDAGQPDAGQPDAGEPDAGFDAGPGGCVDDEHENNDDRQSATVLSATETSITGVLCPNDPDLFQVPVIAGETLTIALGYDAPPGMRLTVSRPGEGVLGTSATGSGLEQVTVVPSTSGFVLARVAAVPTGDARPYGLLFQRTTQGGCQDDAFEPNDSQQSATALPFPADVSARVCSPDPDFFELNPGGASQITVDFVESPSAGLILSVLRRASFTLLAVVTAGSGPTVIDLGDQGGPLLFIVAGAGDADYTFTAE